jgi:hypothetical protein
LLKQVPASSDCQSSKALRITGGAIILKRIVAKSRLPVNTKKAVEDELFKSGQHDRNPVTTKHENSREGRDNGHTAGEQARNMAMVRVREARKSGWSWTP